MTRILITGGAGFIGSRLAERLAAAGHEVTVFDNLSAQVHGADGAETSPTYLKAAEAGRFVRGDVRSFDDIAAAVPGHDAVVHLAAETGTAQSMYAQQHYADVNVTGTINLLRSVSDDPGKSVRKIVVASTRAIYGEGQYLDGDRVISADPRDPARMAAGDFEVHSPRTGAPMQPRATDEECLAKPSSTYAITKLAQEQLILNFASTSGVETVALRLQNVYGPGQSLKNPYTGLLSVFATRILNGKPLTIFEDGLCTRDFVYIDDVVTALTLATEAEGVSGRIINVGSGAATTILDAAKGLERELGLSTAQEIPGMFRAGDIRHNFADISRARALVGYAPTRTFDEGVAAFAAWVRTQPVAEDLFDRSIAELKERKLYGEVTAAE